MTYALYMHFRGMGREQYDKVMKELDLKNSPPAGMISHVAGPLDAGWCVMDIWESQTAFERFHKEKLERAMQNANIKPDESKIINVYNSVGLTSLSHH
jgi:hypothetical protein